eukprot:GHVQ01018692.1.p1 GENE.GHVQ01018692.1~~GHVQ01018692.1.p1  ORF type:complete len:304 (+),score=34.99 GHVQ01018692.1:140-1051(+)
MWSYPIGNLCMLSELVFEYAYWLPSTVSLRELTQWYDINGIYPTQQTPSSHTPLRCYTHPQIISVHLVDYICQQQGPRDIQVSLTFLRTMSLFLLPNLCPPATRHSIHRRLLSVFVHPRSFDSLFCHKNNPKTRTPVPCLLSAAADSSPARPPDIGVASTKVSDRGSTSALFDECIDHLRTAQLQLDPDVDTLPSPVIQKLTSDEISLTKRLFQRIDPNRQVVPSLEAPLPHTFNDALKPGRNRYSQQAGREGSEVGNQGSGMGGSRSRYIDPYWDPFIKVEDLKQQVVSEFNEYARYVCLLL